jgi:sulfur-carrier protein
VTVAVRLADALRAHTDGAAVVDVEVTASGPVTVQAVLDGLDRLHPAVGRRVRDESGALRRHVNVFVGTDNVRDLDGAASPVPAGAVVSILPAVSGG